MTKERITFLILYPIIYLVSKLPLFILYGISNLLYYIFYYIVGYRKSTIKKNLKLCFPDKSPEERLKIEKESLRHFVDIFIEMLKGFTISKKGLQKRYKYTNPEVLEEVYNEDKSVLLAGAHHGNWEWLLNLNAYTSLDCYMIYKKVQNSYFDNFVRDNRDKFGCIAVPTEESIQTIIKNFRKKSRSLYLLLSDQSPQVHKTLYWAPFFGHIVPVHTGTEMLSNRFNFPVVYMHVKMIKRGYYEITFEKLKADENATSKYPLTDVYLRKVEEDISENPSIYLWTHKRFKHMSHAPK